MQHVHIDQFTISGLTIRTNNSTETDPQKAKIGNLWQDFSQNLPAAEETAICYGVYSNFESDEGGEFDLTAGIKGIFPTTKSSEISIPAGTYLRFEKKGAFPAAVIEL
jgi:predicted transcriptional regulator YdeE